MVTKSSLLGLLISGIVLIAMSSGAIALPQKQILAGNSVHHVTSYRSLPNNTTTTGEAHSSYPAHPGSNPPASPPSNQPVQSSKNKSVPQTRHYTLAANSSAQVNTTMLTTLGANIITHDGRYLELTATPRTIIQIRQLSWVSSISHDTQPASSTYNSATSSLQASPLRNLNISGSGVKIGVITVGVNPASSVLQGHVAAAKSFNQYGIRGQSSTHGTAVAKAASAVAPNASLYLTSFSSTVNYYQAVQWLESHHVDIIVMSIGWVTTPQDGTSIQSQIAENATKQGIVWVNSAGNFRQMHYRGPFSDPNHDGWWNISGTDESITLNNGNPLPKGRTVSFGLRWDGANAKSTQYTLHLYDSNYNQIATSQNYLNSQSTTLSATLPHTGTYFIAISGPITSDTLSIYGDATGRFTHDTPTGSIAAPATAKGVLAVGAYNVQTGQLESFSSAGPTQGGRRGIDLLGPDGVYSQTYGHGFYGTSDAAPNVAGTVALLLSENPAATSNQVKNTLEQTAIDMNQSGPDIYTGYGRVNATGAAQAIAPAVPLNITTSDHHPTVGSITKYTVVRSDTGAPVNASVMAGNKTVRTGSPRGTFHINWTSPGTHTLTATPVSTPLTANYRPTNRTVTVHPSKIHSSAELFAAQSHASAGAKTNVTIKLHSPPASIGAYAFNVSVTNQSVATMSAVHLHGSPQATSKSVTKGHVHVSAAGASIMKRTNVSLVTLTLKTHSTGQTGLRITNPNIALKNGTSVSLAGVRNTTLTVSQNANGPIIVGSKHAKTYKGSSTYLDVNGNGKLDIGDLQAFFSHRNQLKGNLKFDYNGNGKVGIADVQTLFRRIVG